MIRPTSIVRIHRTNPRPADNVISPITEMRLLQGRPFAPGTPAIVAIRSARRPSIAQRRSRPLSFHLESVHFERL